MAKKSRPKAHRFADQLFFDIQPAVAAPSPPPPSFLPPLPIGVVEVRYREMGAAEFEQLLDRSNTWSKDRGAKGEDIQPPDPDQNEDEGDLEQDPVAKAKAEAEARKQRAIEIKTLRGFADIFGSDSFVSAGDALLTDRQGGLIEGIKRSLAGSKTEHVHRVLVVQGLDYEVRFSTDDSLSKGRRPKRLRAEAGVVALADAPDPIPPQPLQQRDRKAVSDAMGLMSRLSETLGYQPLKAWTSASLAASVPPSGILASAGVPQHLAIATHAFVMEVAPNHASAFIRDWALGAVAGRSPASLMATSPARPNNWDEHDFLVTLALAIESYVAGDDEDPHALRHTTRRTPRQLLQVLCGREGQLPDRQIHCAFEVLNVATMRELLAPFGIGEQWDPAEVHRLFPLFRDIRRDRGLVRNGQSVKISAGGQLIDGFDRIAACVLAGMPAHVLVARGYREDYDPVRLRGRKQSLGHRLYADGYISPYDVQSLLTNIHRMSEDNRDERVTNTLLRHLHRKHLQAARSVMHVHSLKPVVEISAIGAAHLALSRYSRDLADGFCAELYATWKNEEVASPIRHKLMKLLLKTLGENHRERTTREEAHTICILIQAMNVWCKEQEIEEFATFPKEGFVKLIEPPQIKALQERLALERAA